LRSLADSKPEVPKKDERQGQIINYEHAKDPLGTTKDSQTNYEHADDVLLRRDYAKTALQVNGNPKPKPKPKPRRKTLPGQVILNTDECMTKKFEIPLSNCVTDTEQNSILNNVSSSTHTVQSKEESKTKPETQTTSKPKEQVKSYNQ